MRGRDDRKKCQNLSIDQATEKEKRFAKYMDI